jgi:hypothetical protein
MCGNTIADNDADLTIPSGVTLDLCAQTPTARTNLDYRLSAFPRGGVLVFPAAHTITFGAGDASGLVNYVIERAGASFSPSTFVPANLRDNFNLVAAFAGTAITIPSTAKAVHLHNGMILGFTNGIVSNSKGLRWDHLYVDATNCYSITGSADVAHIEDIVCIPYLTRGTGAMSWPIDNIADDGSNHYKLVAEAPVSDIQWKNGDEIYIATNLTGGAQSANGLHTFVCSGTGGNCDVVANGVQGCTATAGCQVADLSSDSKSTPTSFTATWSAGTRPDGTVQPIITSADLTYVVPGQALTTAFTCDTGHGIASPFPPGTTVVDKIPSQNAVIPSNAPQCAGTAQTVTATDDAFVRTHRGAEMSAVQRHGVGVYCANSGGVTIWNLHSYTHDTEVHADTHCHMRLSSPSFGENDPLAEDDLTTILIDGDHSGQDASNFWAENCTFGQHATKAIVVNSDGGGNDNFVNCGVGTAAGHKNGTMIEVDAGKVLFSNGGAQVPGNIVVTDGSTFHVVYISKADDGDNYTQTDVGAVLTAVAGDNGLTCTTLPQYTIDAVDSQDGSISDGHESRAGVCSVWPVHSDGSGDSFATTGGHGTGAKLLTDGFVPSTLQMANANMANADFYIQTPGGPSFLGVNNTCLIFTACNPVASPQTVGTALYPTTGKELDMMGTISSGSTALTITSGCNIAAQGQWAYSFFTAAVTKFTAVSCTGDTGTATLSIAATADQLTPGALAAGRTRYNATSSVIANAGLFKYLNVGSASQGANTWLNQYLWGVDSSEGIAGSVPVYAISPIGQRAGVFASRSSDNTIEAALTTPLVSYLLDDNTTTHHPAHALYLVLDRTAGADASRGIEAEFSFHSLQSCAVLDPYTINALGDCENLVLDNGLNAHDSPAKASDALHILNNETGGGGMYSAGIIFDQGAMDTGSGTAPAIELPKNFGIQWFRTAGNPAWTIASSANTNTNTLDLGNSAATFSTNVVGTSFSTTGDKSAAFWGANGTRFNAMAATYTDTTSSGASGILPIDSFGVPTIASTSASSPSTVATVYIAGQPVAGTNITLPPAATYALDVATGNVNIGGTGAKTSIAGFESISGDGIASVSPLLLNGNMFTGGSGSTTLPYMLLKLGNPTPGSSYSTSGTMLGFNGPSGFAGNILDAHVNGGASVFAVSAAGGVTAASLNGTTPSSTGLSLLGGASASADRVTLGTISALHQDISTSITLTASNFCNTYRVDATAGALTETLPASGTTDDCIAVRKTDSGANRVTVNYNGGTAAAWLSKQYDEAMFAYWGGGWTPVRWSIAPLAQVFTASGTWTQPPLMKYARVVAIGAGGCGGSGRRGAAGSARGGGLAGGSGGVSIMNFNAPDLSATETVTIGAICTAGAAQTVDSTDGNAGAAGADATFGAHLRGAGGIAGPAGSTTTVAAPSSSSAAPGQIGGITGQSPQSDSVAAVANATGPSGGPSAGGAGGGISTGNVDFSGAASASASNSSSTAIASAGGGANGGANAGTAGNACSDSVNCFGGSGGGGGGGDAAGAGGAGGAGGAPGGAGGGGGASVNGSASGAGAVGARGEVRVTGYF